MGNKYRTKNDQWGVLEITFSLMKEKTGTSKMIQSYKMFQF